MEEIAQNNMLKMLYNNLLYETMVRWSKSKNRAFIACFKDVLKEKGYDYKKEGLDTRFVLCKVINYLNSTIIAKLICYAYEIILLDEDSLNLLKKSDIFKTKDKTFVSEDITSDYQLINFIRNAISHNNDFNDNLYVYSDIDENYTFRLNKEGQENSSVVINKRVLIDLLCEYVENSKMYKIYNSRLVINLDNIVKSSNNNQLINIQLDDSGKFIDLDDNQRKVIEWLVNDIKNNKSLNMDFVKLHYPYKQNIVNNYLNALDFNFFINGIYECRGNTFYEYLYEAGKLGLIESRKQYVTKDLTIMYRVNRLFQMFSTTDNKFISENLDGVISFNKYNKLRNSIIHGTYFIDFEGNIYIYDAPRNKKQEENLKFVDVITKEDFISIIDAFSAKKYDKKNIKK